MIPVAGFTLSNDPARLPVEEIHRWLAGESYWSRNILYAQAGFTPLEQPERWMERRPVRGYPQLAESGPGSDPAARPGS